MLRFTLPAMAFGAILFQQQMKINIDKSIHYRRIAEQISKQLQVTVKQKVSKQDVLQAGPQKMLSQYRDGLKKRTVEQVQIVTKLKKQDYRVHHLITAGILGCGLAMAPVLFMFASAGYIALYQYYYFDRMLRFRFGVQVPFSYNFESMHYLYTAGCGVLLAIGGTLRIMHKVYQINAPKYLTIKKK